MNEEEKPLLVQLNYGDFQPSPPNPLESETRYKGKCINLTGDVIIFYGEQITPGQQYETSLFYLEPGKSTPNGFDADGFYVPNDRVLKQISTRRAGPVAVKFRDFQTFKVTQSGNEYVLDTINFGVFTPSEGNISGCPSEWPFRVCWEIPNISAARVAELFRLV